MYFQLYGCDGVGLGYETYANDAASFITEKSRALDDGTMDCEHEEFPFFGRAYFGAFLSVLSACCKIGRTVAVCSPREGAFCTSLTRGCTFA